MTPHQFASALAATSMPAEGRTATACRLVLVDGLTAYAAAAQVGVNESAVSRAANRLRGLRTCPTCGQARHG